MLDFNEVELEFKETLANIEEKNKQLELKLKEIEKSNIDNEYIELSFNELYEKAKKYNIKKIAQYKTSLKGIYLLINKIQQIEKDLKK